MDMRKGKPKAYGRKAGTPNKVTTEFRETVRNLLESNSENVSRWLTEVAEGNEEKNVKSDPGRALDLMSKLAEYASPKLSRAEHVGEGGGDIGLTMTVTHVKPSSIGFDKS